ncbi:895_t:CDS:2 [Ambispora gerdemannii]|uniref:895_t:CDS:1 n=1 Tax=Ambispora gerdemannii TaxID=144530 RepID=A0A9N9BLH2_9GLOM|nr:895_t:CDS:2 [Ambispora gerdemannii]
MYLFSTHKKGISSCQLAKDLVMLENSVEIDETFIGDKVPVLGILERKGNVIAQVVPNVKRNTLEPIIKSNVEKGSNVYTDE